MGDNSCEICHSVAKYKCSKCNKTHYCCKEHQIQDWPVHKGDCQPCKVIHNSAKGNILIATRVITTWSTIEKERPLIVLPYSGNDNRNGSMDEMCIGCFKVINPQVNKTCSKCGWPVCGPTCELIPDHARNECHILAKSQFIPSLYGSCMVIQVLRCLLLKEEHPKSFKSVHTTEAIKKYFHEDITIEEKDVAILLGIISSNGLSQMADVIERNDERFTMYVYYYACIASHSCVPNARSVIRDTGRLELIATRPIQPGEEITISYIALLNGTLQRKESCARYYFTCDCPRCVDPTELGTHFSSIKCQQCRTGYISLHMGNSAMVQWICGDCSQTRPIDQVEDVLDYFDMESKLSCDLQECSMRTVKQFESILTRYEGKVLHENHYLLYAFREDFIRVMYKFLEQGPNGWNTSKRTARDVKIIKTKMVKIVRMLLKTVNVFTPGPRSLRGKLLYYLCIGLRDKDALNQNDGSSMGYNNLNDKGVAQDYKVQIHNVAPELKTTAIEAIKILSLEPQGTEDALFVVELKKILGTE
ncbi:SET domain-containing protein SmydA-8 isoform X3 [Folsomia candida]|uniref:SET domain-containing protein SmydA-8 isoform X3 n=1 Tax=Folsomia candida TaxID=158441 RepID=UPI0016050883|nr:SET domain-containing protein SmydA-8 isoform X3 [Folsomia candida]